MDQKELLEQDIELAYTLKRDGKAPQITLRGLWKPNDVLKMSKLVMREARIHKAKLVKQFIEEKENERSGKKRSGKK